MTFRVPSRRRARMCATLAVVVALVGVLPATPAAAAPADERQAVPGELLVTMDRGHTTGSWLGMLVPGVLDVDRLSRRVARIRTAAGLEELVAGRIAALPGVVAVERNRRLSYTAVPDDEFYPDQWTHRLANTEAAWDVSTGTAQVTIAILDSGINANHPELDNVVYRADASTGSIQPGSVDNDSCEIGHGTMVAGVAAAAGDNGTGIAGVNWEVALVDVALSSPDAGCDGPTDAAVIAALDHVTNGLDRRVSAVNMSFGAPDDACPQAYQSAIDEARAAGIVLVAASGNEQQVSGLAGQPQVPASCNGVISVGATGADGAVAPYSTRNEHVDLVAPGGDRTDGSDRSALVLTTSRSGGYTTVEGSSFSSPYVAGLVGLLRAANAALSAAQVEAVLEGTARDRGEPGRDPAYGWGLIDAGAAMRRGSAGDIPPLQPDPTFPTGGEIDSPPFIPLRAAKDGPLQFHSSLLRVP